MERKKRVGCVKTDSVHSKKAWVSGKWVEKKVHWVKQIRREQVHSRLLLRYSRENRRHFMINSSLGESKDPTVYVLRLVSNSSRYNCVPSKNSSLSNRHERERVSTRPPGVLFPQLRHLREGYKREPCFSASCSSQQLALVLHYWLNLKLYNGQCQEGSQWRLCFWRHVLMQQEMKLKQPKSYLLHPWCIELCHCNSHSQYYCEKPLWYCRR